MYSKHYYTICHPQILPPRHYLCRSIIDDPSSVHSRTPSFINKSALLYKGFHSRAAAARMPPRAPSTGAAVCLAPALPEAPVEVCVEVPVLVVLEALVVERPVLVVAEVVVEVDVVVLAELVAGLPLEDEVVEAAAPPLLLEVEVQTTVLGTLTWLAWQICCAKSMAFCWSSALQAPIRQHEMAEMKSLSAQMQAASRPQLPMPPFRKMLAQLCCCEEDLLLAGLKNVSREAKAGTYCAGG